MCFLEAERDWSQIKYRDLTKPVKGFGRFPPGNGRIVGGQEATPHQFPFQVNNLHPFIHNNFR